MSGSRYLIDSCIMLYQDIVAFNLIKTEDQAPSIRPNSYNTSSSAEQKHHYMMCM